MNQQNQNKREWKEHQSTSNNQRWEPQKQNFDPNNPPYIQGYFKDLREQTGANGIFMIAVITLVNPDGSLAEDVDVSGGKVLDDKLGEITLGAYIMIKYGGKQASKTPGRSYNIWNIYEDTAAVPYQNLGGVVKRQAQSNNTNQNQNNGNNNGGGNNQGTFNNGGGQNNNSGPVYNTNQNQNAQNNSAPVFNTNANQNNGNTNNGQNTNVTGNSNQKPYVAPVNNGQNTNQNQNNGNNNGGGNGQAPIFTGNPADDDDLPF